MQVLQASSPCSGAPVIVHITGRDTMDASLFPWALSSFQTFNPSISVLCLLLTIINLIQVPHLLWNSLLLRQALGIGKAPDRGGVTRQKAQPLGLSVTLCNMSTLDKMISNGPLAPKLCTLGFCRLGCTQSGSMEKEMTQMQWREGWGWLRLS